MTMTMTTIRRTLESGNTLIHAVRVGRLWYCVEERDGSYRTNAYVAPVTTAGLAYVASGDSHSWGTLKSLWAEILEGVGDYA